MPQHTVTWLDRLRIEWVVWSLDQRLYDLHPRVRVARRREVRANLLEAAMEVGAAEAVRRIGNARTLAEGFRAAERGDGPRYSWIAATTFLLTAPLLFNFFLDEAAKAYQQAITATSPHSDGTYIWSGIAWLQSSVTIVVHHGEATRSGGAWTPLDYVLLLVGAIACGRLWRALPRRSNTAA
ncbi:hypothetical protein [Actinomadura rupiterrae]|uniref:hypothetical protein n=1 Tax=Actinomadura rupiterrae TaxID=559627 RepID=UPI0020A36DF6|nr:hypothetical protein [Actinomadura rupiterrae]MCP2339305.1 hypothetical protein [Actinomadura rupiterrae]